MFSKTIIVAGSLLFLLSMSVMAASKCGDLIGCEKKFCEIELQRSIALEKGNQQQAKNLATALKNAKKYCTVEDLKTDLMADIQKSTGDIAEYKVDLIEAQQEDKADKVRKYQRKITEEQHKLKRLRARLSEFN